MKKKSHNGKRKLKKVKKMLFKKDNNTSSLKKSGFLSIPSLSMLGTSLLSKDANALGLYCPDGVCRDMCLAGERTCRGVPDCMGEACCVPDSESSCPALS